MKVLLAFDGSVFSEAAVRAITSQMRPAGTEVLVLQVVEPRIFLTAPHMAPGYAPEQEEILKEQLEEAEKSAGQAAEALKAAGYQARARVLAGETRSGILDVAAEWRADLIVLGSHGRKGSAAVPARQCCGIGRPQCVLFGSDCQNAALMVEASLGSVTHTCVIQDAAFIKSL